MSINYNKKLIWDYINGVEIPNIDELESDYKFIMEVIKITNDKNMYNLCSEEIKSNYEFIKFIIETFKHDKKYIIRIAEEYLNKTDSEDLTYKELIFLMCELTNVNSNNYDDFTIFYTLKRCTIYLVEKFRIEQQLQEEDYNTKLELGLGFGYILYNELGESEIITKYFAQKYLEEIFYENNELPLENLVHKHFSTYEELKKVGIKNYILTYINFHDKYLKDYLLDNITLIESIERSIKNIGLNWENYTKRNNMLKHEQFEMEANKLIVKYDSNYSYEEFCYFIDKMKLNLPLKLSNNTYQHKYMMELNINNENEIVNIQDYKCLKEIIKLAKKIYILSDKENKLETKLFFIQSIKEESNKFRVINLNKIKRK